MVGSSIEKLSGLIMDRSKQGAAVAVIAIGIIIVAISAGVLISELRKERAARKEQEQETAQLQEEIEKLKRQPIKWARTYSRPSTPTPAQITVGDRN